MLKEQAIVVKIEAQDIWVKSNRQSVCGGCSVRQGCGVSLVDQFFNKFFDRNAERALTQLSNDSGLVVRVGDQVVVGMPENVFIKSALLVYLLPLGFLFGFAFAGQYFNTLVLSAVEPSLVTAAEGDGVIALFAMIGLGIGFWRVKGLSEKISRDKNYKAVLLEKY